MRKKSSIDSLILKDLEKLFLQDEMKVRKKVSKKILNDFEKLIAKEKSYNDSKIAKVRKKVLKSNSKNKIIKTRKSTKQVINKKLDLDYIATQKYFMLSTPLRMNKKMLTGNNFTNFLNENFYTDVYKFFNDTKNFIKNKYTLATVGYHFYFKRGNEKTYQSGFRKPRQLLTKTNINKVINELFKQTFERFDVYFKTRGSSSLYFEGMTAEISYDNKTKKTK